MKTLFFFLFILLSSLSCQIKESSKKIEKPIEVQKKEIQPLVKEIWGLTNYLDTIIEKKELAKYRLQAPSWFGILLEISKDSIISYGSIVEINDKLYKSNDTLYKFESFAKKWLLLKKNENLILKQLPNQKTKFDSTIYVYRKRKDLNFLLKNKDESHKISTNITNYFNKELLSGDYISQKTKRKVEFSKNGGLKGFKNFTQFQVRNYFGTHHPHRNLDVIFFKNPKDKR